MVIVKNPEQIEGIRKSCRLLAQVMDHLTRAVRPGVSTRELNALAEKLIADGGGQPAFKGYRSTPSVVPFPSALCASVDDIVVHGPAVSAEPLKEGSVIGLDLGINLNGYFSDMAVTVPVGSISSRVQTLVSVAKKALENGIKQIEPGKSIRDISLAIEQTIIPHGFGIIRGFAGHGVGLQVHEDPWIPNYVDETSADHLDVRMRPGHIFAIEPMITNGGEDVTVLEDGWSVMTSDRSLSAHFEHTVLVTEAGHEILTVAGDPA
jgi:methionyl aminopeptidase